MYGNIEEIIQQESWLSQVNDENFEDYALMIFHYQYKNNALYQDFVNAIHRNPYEINRITDIPFLPILFFKTYRITTKKFEPQLIFESSGTTETMNSKHFVKDAHLYKESFLQNFQEFYGDPQSYIFLCLLPSYLERNNSSLVYMANDLIQKSEHEESGFYLNEWESLAEKIKSCIAAKKKVILLGVTFALLDFAEAFPMDLSSIIVMETGGMKGRRAEWSRKQVHDFLKEKWHLPEVHSEYGMTELLSQAYSKGNGIFKSPKIMKVLARSESDPFEIKTSGNGCLNVIDLANVHSCSFIATDDLVRIYPNLDFEVLGRLDHSALRGCSLMVL